MKFFESELEAWDMIAGPKNRLFRRKLHRDFRRMFHNKGHEASIRDFVECCSSRKEQRRLRSHERAQFLLDIHYRAFDLIAEHGLDYRPYIWRSRPPWGEPTPTACFYNAYWLAEVNRYQREQLKQEGKIRERPLMVYVEGIALGVLVMPMLHAWNAWGLEGTIAYDWTFYSGTKWTRYLGIPLTLEEYKKATGLCRVRPKIHLLMKKKHFPKVESYLEDLLAARRETAEQT